MKNSIRHPNQFILVKGEVFFKMSRKGYLITIDGWDIDLYVLRRGEAYPLPKSGWEIYPLTVTAGAVIRDLKSKGYHCGQIRKVVDLLSDQWESEVRHREDAEGKYRAILIYGCENGEEPDENAIIEQSAEYQPDYPYGGNSGDAWLEQAGARKFEFVN